MKGKNFVYDHFYQNKWHTCGVFLTLILEVGMDILMAFIFGAIDRKSTRLNPVTVASRMPSSA